jgi:hypothetical protein
VAAEPVLIRDNQFETRPFRFGTSRLPQWDMGEWSARDAHFLAPFIPT